MRGDYPGRTVAGARPAPERRHRLRRRPPRRRRWLVDGVCRRPHAGQRRGDARRAGSTGGRASRHRLVPRGCGGAQGGAGAPRHQGAQRHARRQRTHRADGFRGRRAPPERSGAWSAAGTPLYLAPELFDGAPATIASDVYSMGVLLFYLVTKRYPVEGATLDEIAAAQARQERYHLGDLRPDSGQLRDDRGAGARPRPGRRYRTCDEMQRDLMDAARQYGSPEVPAAAPDRSERTATVAVLPFANLGPDCDVEYLSSGLADELLTGLGKYWSSPRLADVGGPCRRRGNGHTTPLPTPRRRCRDRRHRAESGERVRIMAQLVSAADGCHLWSDGYDRYAGDVFAVVDDIARRVVDRLSVSRGGAATAADRPTPDNARAYRVLPQGTLLLDAPLARRAHGCVGALQEGD